MKDRHNKGASSTNHMLMEKIGDSFEDHHGEEKSPEKQNRTS